MLKTVLISVFSAAALAAFICACVTKKPVRVFTTSGATGLALLAAMCATNHYLGFGLTLNLYSLISSIVLGPPGIIMMLVFNLL